MSEAFDKYKNAFLESFKNEQLELEILEYQSITEWDSIGHLNLISNLELAFGISMEMDDIIEFSSFNKGKEILKKYGIVFE
jgi:acyl carrier protein